MKSDSEFPAIPSYNQSTAQNQSWVNVTLTKIEADGTVTQTFFIAKK